MATKLQSTALPKYPTANLDYRILATQRLMHNDSASLMEEILGRDLPVRCLVLHPSGRSLAIRFSQVLARIKAQGRGVTNDQ
jgi:hypothetical protein